MAMAAISAAGLCVQIWIAWAVPDAMMLAAIPTFGAMIACEAMIQRARPAPEPAAKYTAEDTLFSIIAGTTQILVGTAAVEVPLNAAYERLWELGGRQAVASESLPAFVALIVLADFAYYWMHRWSHEYQVLWTGHSVHHSSRHYNLSTALRQSWWQGAYNLTLLLLFPFAAPVDARRARYLTTVYQFWVHTCHIGDLGFLEEFLMTPSHHRVHHDERVHKNYAGVLLWDRLFGTFLQEPSPRPVCRFGSRFDPHFSDSVRQLQEWKQKSWRKLLKGPGYHTSAIPRALVRARELRPTETPKPFWKVFVAAAVCTAALCVSRPTLMLFMLDCAVQL